MRASPLSIALAPVLQTPFLHLSTYCSRLDLLVVRSRPAQHEDELGRIMLQLDGEVQRLVGKARPKIESAPRAAAAARLGGSASAG